MHVLFLTDNFPPEVNAPASRTFEHCREWVRAGHRVTIVTCAPNFPIGKVFSGYKNGIYQLDEIDRVRVIRVWSYITANEGFIRRTLDYLSYMASATIVAPFVRDVDVVVATSPQFFTACAGWIVSILKRRPFVFELRDLWPASIQAVGAINGGPILRTLERLELFLYRRASAIVTVTHAFRANLIARGIDGLKISVVTNGADLSRFRRTKRDPELVEELGLKDKIVVGYIGTHGMAHALHTVLEAAAELTERQEVGVQFLFLGDGATKRRLKEQAEQLSLRNVTFLDTVPKAEVIRYWSLLDLSIIHLKRDDLFQTVIPSKLFESMAMGVPVLLGVEGESARLVAGEGVGVVFQPENSADLVDRILQLAESKANREIFAERAIAVARRYDRVQLAAQMLSVLTKTHERWRVASAADRFGRSR